MNKITIGLATYNRPMLLKRAVRSILNQSYNNFKLLIGNDYPFERVTYKTLGIKENKKVIIFNHKKNLGERNNMNFLLNKSKSKWFIWLSDHDYFHKDLFKRLLKQVKNFTDKPIACYSNYSRKKLKKTIKKKKPEILSKEIFLKGFTNKEIRLIGVYGIINTNILKKIKGIHKTGMSFSIDNKITHHYPYCDPLVPLMLSGYGKILWVDEKLVFLNTDNTSVSSFTKEYDVYKSSEDYINKKISKVIDNLDINSQNEIKKNMLEWYFFNRLKIIENRNILTNFFYALKYFYDLLILIKKNNKILSYKYIIKGSSKIFKSIFKSGITK